MDKLITVIGMLAATGTTISFLPQAIKVIQTKDTKSISLSMYILFISGVILWFIYGILKSDIPVMIANGATLILASTILYFKIKHP